MADIGLFRRYAKYLPIGDPDNLVDLGEGRTPIVKSRWIGTRVGLPELYFKLEQLNPTGSYKDRFAGMMISVMRERGQMRFLATSSGNTGAALAAYSARYGMECHVFVLQQTPEAKLLQMLAYGARLYRVKGFGISPRDTAAVFERLGEVARSGNTPLVVSAFCQSPDGMAGVKTLAYEIAEQLEEVHHVFLPVGGGGLLTATWRGYRDLEREGFVPPMLDAVQPRLNDTVVTALRNAEERAREVDTVTTISGLAVPQDLDATAALVSVRESGGNAYLVEDDEARAVQRELMEREGLFVEPAAAVSVAGVIRAKEQGHVNADQRIVCVLTGHGFKDHESLEPIRASRDVLLIKPDDITVDRFGASEITA